MTPQEFVQCFRREKDDLLLSYCDASSQSFVATKVAELARSPEERLAMRAILDNALTDAFYTILSGLDGSGSLGGVQQSYQIRDEHGDVVCMGDGEIQGLAYAAFECGRID